MATSILPLLLPLLITTSGCVLDRTGQSASETWHREALLQRTRTDNLENQFTEIEARVDQLEELTRARGQDEIMRMETLDQVRTEVANIRGDVEVLNHDIGRKVIQGAAQAEDAAYRLQWLEDRTAQLESSLGLEPTPPPVIVADEADADTGDTADSADGGTQDTSPGDQDRPLTTATAVTDPDEMLALAKEHLAAGRNQAAEAVLNRLVKLHPDDANLAEVRYRLAEASFNAGEYQAAVLRFQEVIDRYKKSAWAPWAMLRQGECFDKQGQPDNAKLFYEDVVRLWPKSKAAKDARGRL
ncbi:MAG: tetratricopeptide repeat protein [Oligoflexia bacterium]|nr:tetratricopeptide repeat protein [Oligoflexia bacterium]